MNIVKLFIKQWGLYLVITAGLLWLLGSSPGWYHSLRLRRHVYNTRLAIQKLNAERDELIAAIRFHTPDDSPDSDSRVAFAHEKCAREVLQLGRKDEVVYRV